MVKVALLIGVSEYEPGLNPLPAAIRDIDAMQQVLVNPEIGGFAETDIVVLKNPERQEIEETIEHLFAHRHRDDLLVLFFSGHGIKDDTGRLYLATRTTRKTLRGDLIRSSAVAANFVHESMSRSRSKRQVVILDCCFSGAFAEGMSAKDDGSVNIREQLGGEGRAILASSSSTQYSFEQEGSDLSIYTRYLIEGITTGAADNDGDDFISIDELHDYASTKVREIQPEMKPEIYTNREGFKIRLAKVPVGDPKQKYRKEVARYIKRGQISFIGRQTLDVLKIRLGLSEIEANNIEDEILAVTRQEFQEKLQQYERAFTNVLQQEVAPSQEDINELRQNLQQMLGLRNEDTMPIEAQIQARIEASENQSKSREINISLKDIKVTELIVETKHSLIQKCLVDGETYVLKRTKEELCQIRSLKKLVGREIIGYMHSTTLKIATPSAVWLFDGYVFELTPYYEGINLYDVIIKNKYKIQGEFIGEIYNSLVFALEQLHDMGILHRDIVPSNILITNSQQLLLLDCTFSCEIGSSQLPVQNSSFSAPEQNLGNACIQSEWYSVATTIYFLANGHPPQWRNKNTLIDGLKKIQIGSLRVSSFFKTSNENVIERNGFATLLYSLMNPDFKQRPETVVEIRLDDITRIPYFSEVLGILNLGSFGYLITQADESRIIPPNEITDFLTEAFRNKAIEEPKLIAYARTLMQG